MNNLTLVLGAGSSAGYGYPIGKKLKALILTDGFGTDVAQMYIDFLDFMSTEHQNTKTNIDKFKSEFRRSGSETIDTFLSKYDETNSEQVLILNHGKLLISFYISAYEYLILKNEERPSKDQVKISEDEPDDWISYFTSKTLSHEENETISRIFPNVISFNYDNIFLKKIKRNLESEHTMCTKEILSILNNKIINVYGSITDEISADINKDELFKIIIKNANNISLIRRKNECDDRINRIRKMINESDRIILLGYGFDKFNNRILFQTIDNFVTLAASEKIFATMLGLPSSILSQLQDYQVEHLAGKCTQLLENKALPIDLFPQDQD